MVSLIFKGKIFKVVFCFFIMVFVDLVVYGVLPFLLVYVIIFAILQKSKLFGEGKTQIDTMIAIVIALILVVIPGPQKEIIIFLMPWLSVALAVLLVFFILYGFIVGDLTNAGNFPNWIKMSLGVLVFIFVVSLVVYISGFDLVVGSWLSGRAGDYLISAVFLLIVAGAIAWVFFSSKK